MPRLSRRKIRRLFNQLLVALAALGLLIKVGELQVTHALELARASEENRLRRIPLPAPRGGIYDRRGTPLALDEPAYAVGLLAPPTQTPTGERLEELCELLGLEATELLERFSEGRSYPYEPARLVENADAALLTRVAEADDPGLVITSRPRRSYPNGECLAHVLGYLDEVRPEELERGYRLGELIGRKGLEAYYEEELRGVPGEEVVEVDAHERRIATQRHRAPLPGDSLILSIDLGLQRTAEAILAETSYRRPYDWPADREWSQPEPGLRGSIIVMDVQTGELLALATRPTYDPNRVGAGGDPDYWRRLNADPDKPLLARAYQSTYPPGSTFKLVDATAGLLTGAVTPDGRMDQPCGGVFRLGDTAFHCWGHIGHGSLTLTEAIGWSCNVYFYQLGLRLGIEGIREYGSRYGLNEPTGIDLPHERAGQLPSLERLEERWGERWPRGQICNNAIGQGDVLVSPLELLTMYASIANGGRLLEPRLVSRIVGPDGRPRRRLEPVVRRELELPDWVRQTLITGMKNVLRRFGPNPVELCGKTGTSENPHGEPHAWFCGFAPADEPRLAVVIMIENGGFGESYIKYAKRLLAYCFANGLPDDEPVGCLDPLAVRLTACGAGR